MRHLLRTIAARLPAAALILAFLACGTATAREWKVVRIGSEGAYPPFNYRDSRGQLQGFEIDLARSLCDTMRVTCRFVVQDWDGMIPALLANRFDAIMSSMTITAERQQHVAFSEPYYRTPMAFAVARGSILTGHRPTDLAGRTLGAQAGTVHASFLNDLYPEAGATVRLFTSQEEAQLALATGRIDALLASKVALLDWMNKSREGKCCAFLGSDVVDPRYFGKGAAVGVRKKDTELLGMFNEAIATIVANGTYRKICRRHFPFDIY